MILSVIVGPVPVGVNSFDFTAAAPQPNLLPSTASEEILGVTVLILTASYRDKEFVRVGYYVNTEYEDEERRLEPPTQVDFKGLVRNVLVDKPKVTRFSVCVIAFEFGFPLERLTDALLFTAPGTAIRRPCRTPGQTPWLWTRCQLEQVLSR